MKCEKCGRTIRHFAITKDGKIICDHCASLYYTQCTVCGALIPQGENQCDECKGLIFKKVLNPYSTKVNGIFGNKDGTTKCLNNRYFGCEWEFSSLDPSVPKFIFKDQYDGHMIYNKSDSSLHNGGEIVTIPLVKSRMLSLIDSMNFPELKKYKEGDMHDNAGVHIHVSRNTISPIDVTKLSLLFNSTTIAYRYRKYLYTLLHL